MKQFNLLIFIFLQFNTIAQYSDLHVKITNIKEVDGHIEIGLYNNPEVFPEVFVPARATGLVHRASEDDRGEGVHRAVREHRARDAHHQRRDPGDREYFREFCIRRGLPRLRHAVVRRHRRTVTPHDDGERGRALVDERRRRDKVQRAAVRRAMHRVDAEETERDLHRTGV